MSWTFWYLNDWKSWMSAEAVGVYEHREEMINRKCCFKSNTFTSLTGESVVVVPRCFVSTHHTQLVRASAPPSWPHPGPPAKSHRPKPMSQSPREQVRTGITGGLQAVRVVLAGSVAELRGRGRGGRRGGGGRWGAVEGEGQVGREVRLLAVREQLEVWVREGITQRLSQHVWKRKHETKELIDVQMTQNDTTVLMLQLLARGFSLSSRKVSINMKKVVTLVL